MAIDTTTEKNNLCTRYGTDTAYASLHTGDPGTTGTGEISGGSPAYARKAVTWSAPSNGQITASVTFDVASGVTVAGVGLWTAATGGSYLDGTTITSQTLGAQGTVQVSLTFSAA